jgi:regulator of protease activity HflC (stomatin/prohibitin superfamily)
MKRTPVLAVAAAILLAGTAGCANSVEPDRAGLEYNAGAFSSTKFDNCVAPGTRAWHGPQDRVYSYPAGQRTYEFGATKEADSGAIEIVTKDNLTMQVTGVATFALNTDCKALQRFHERIGIKYGAQEEAGWNKMLGVYLRQPLDRAMDAAAKKHPWKDLYSNPTVKRAWETEVGTTVVQQVNTVAGGNVFCAPGFTGKGPCGVFSLTLQQPTPPPNVRNALASAQEAIERATAQKNENVRVQTELDSIKALVKVLGAQGYILYQAIKEGKIKIVPVPAGGAINVTGD